MAQTWNPSDKDSNISLAESNLLASAAYGGWVGARSTESVEASTANKYCEFKVASLGNYCMVGICKSTDPLANMYTGANARLYYSNGTYYNNGGGSSYGSTWTTNDVIGLLIKNGKLYFRKNGTWLNSANVDAETGAVATGLTGAYFLAMLCYSASIRLRLAAADLVYSVPAGASLFVRPGTVTATLLLPDSSPVASASVQWAFFEQTQPSLLAAPVAKGTASTNGSGVLTLAIPNTDLANGATGSLLISNTTGDPSVQCRSHFAPVAISVP